ncbi:Auxin-responsive protein [Thalictrum thalictroides]|uniref:Auxin-responsive protein n=1 Tax=Thalictrum thalictroides TaxID=46969 RepID=A0A7J6V2L4_THATH|nr:Auxin-responsive protein [Thalictrum thalictroides]
MAKGGKLLKLKSVLKKWHSMSRSLGRTNSSISAAATSDDDYSYENNHNSQGLHAVYVGKSRRRYLIGSDIIDNPIVRELVDRSNGSDALITVDCEVVLFEHLLWMLENADPQPESLDELVEFYAW